MKYLFLNKDKILFVLFLCLLLLIKLPAIYLLPFNGILSISHTIAKGLLVLLLVIVFVTDGKSLSLFIGKNKPLYIILLVYFVGQSLSVLGAKEVFLFWKGFHNVVSGLTIFLLAYYFVLKSGLNLKKTTDFILVAGLSLVIIELVFFFFAPQLIGFVTKIAQPEVADAYLTNLGRGRNSLDMNIELFFPFFLLALLDRKLFIYRWVLGLAILGLTFLAFASNFRTRLLDLVFISSASALLLIRHKGLVWLRQSRKWLVSLLIIIPVVLSAIVSNRLFNYNIFDRLALKDTRFDVETLSFRYQAAAKSTELFSSSPFFGVGLGNYVYYASRNTSAFDFYFLGRRNLVTYSELAAYSPHNVLFNILAESGLLGIVSYLYLIAFFATRDLKRYTHKKIFDVTSAAAVSFWMLFLFMLFNPSHSIFVIGWFWFLRGLVEANYVKES